MAKGLTVRKVAKLLRRGEPGRYLDSTRGLYLVVAGKRNANWTLRYQLQHRTRWMGLGSAFTFSLEEARRRANSARQKLADKIDPLAVKHAEQAEAKAKEATAEAARATIKTFRQCVEGSKDFEGYIAAKAKEWRSARHGQQWRATLRDYVYPVIGARNVADIDKAAVLSVLEQPVTKRDGTIGKFWAVRTVTANRVRSRIELVLAYAAARGFRDETRPNPAAWDLLNNILAAPAKAAPVKHHPALPYQQMSTLLAELRGHEGMGVTALEFLILTAGRMSEVIGAKWDEFDLDAAMWVIPARRMKAGAEHRVPLSTQAVTLLRSLYTEENNSHVFIGARGAAVSDSAVAIVLRRLGRADITVHGFRSSFSDWAHETTAYPTHAIELSLAHTVGSEVELAYRRGDMFAKRRMLMQAWADYCYSPPQATTAEVVPLRQGQR